MENASKALIIAGSVLLMILVLTFAMFIFRKIGSQSTEMYENLNQSTIDEFNQTFYNYETTYIDGKPTNILRIQDVVSILNLAKSYNQSQKYPVVVNVKFNNTDNKQDNYNSIELLENRIDEKYTCKVKMVNNSKLVDLIEINITNT